MARRADEIEELRAALARAQRTLSAQQRQLDAWKVRSESTSAQLDQMLKEYESKNGCPEDSISELEGEMDAMKQKRGSTSGEGPQPKVSPLGDPASAKLASHARTTPSTVAGVESIISTVPRGVVLGSFRSVNRPHNASFTQQCTPCEEYHAEAREALEGQVGEHVSSARPDA